VPAELLEHGPSAFVATIGERFAGANPALHVINIRDWHHADDSYDAERAASGGTAWRGRGSCCRWLEIPDPALPRAMER
jgi:hypothetical protein